MYDDRDSVSAALRAGARGYLVKGASGERIVDAVRAVADGEAVFGAGVAADVLGRLADQREARARGRSRRSPNASWRSCSSSPAAAPTPTSPGTLVVSDKTVRNHVSNVFAKLGVPDRAQAIVRARQAGLG